MNDKRQYMDAIRSDPFLNGLMMSYDQACTYTEGRCVLDYGCGYGWGSFLLSGNAGQVVGYDPDKSRIQFARTIFPAENITYITDTATLSDRGFDMVCLFLVLPCARDPWHVLEHVRRCLAPGGWLWLSFKSDDDWLEELVAGWILQKNMQLLYSGSRKLSETLELVEKVLCIC